MGLGHGRGIVAVELPERLSLVVRDRLPLVAVVLPRGEGSGRRGKWHGRLIRCDRRGTRRRYERGDVHRRRRRRRGRLPGRRFRVKRVANRRGDNRWRGRGSVVASAPVIRAVEERAPIGIQILTHRHRGDGLGLRRGYGLGHGLRFGLCHRHRLRRRLERRWGGLARGLPRSRRGHLLARDILRYSLRDLDSVRHHEPATRGGHRDHRLHGSHGLHRGPGAERARHQRRPRRHQSRGNQTRGTGQHGRSSLLLLLRRGGPREAERVDVSRPNTAGRRRSHAKVVRRRGTRSCRSCRSLIRRLVTRRRRRRRRSEGLGRRRRGRGVHLVLLAGLHPSPKLLAVIHAHLLAELGLVLGLWQGHRGRHRAHDSGHGSPQTVRPGAVRFPRV